MRFRLVSLLCSYLFIVLFINSCSERGQLIEPTEQEIQIDLNGQWNFQFKLDSDTMQNRSNSMVTKIIHEGGSSFTGTMRNNKIDGVKEVNNIKLNLYDFADGSAIDDSVFAVSFTMELKVINDTLLLGKGHGLNEMDSTVFSITATKFKYPVLQGGLTSFLKQQLEDFATDFVSGLIGTATGGVIKLMSGGGWFRKEGGGYYIFGRYGPGADPPIHTLTLYYPLEFGSWGVRSYWLDVKLKDYEPEYWDKYQQVLDRFKKFFKAIGFSEIDNLINAIEDFKKQVPKFAISWALNTNTGGFSLYINIEDTDKINYVKNHPIVNYFKDALKKLNKIPGFNFEEFYLKVGKNIDDRWNLRRPFAIVDGTPLILGYFIGTCGVEYK